LRPDSRAVAKTNDDIVIAKTFVALIYRRAIPNAAPYQFESQSQSGEGSCLSAGQEEVNAIGLVTIRQRSFPGDIRLIESKRQTRGQTIETDRIGPGAVKIIVREWVICRIVKRIARNPGDFARTQIVNKIFLRNSRVGS